MKLFNEKIFEGFVQQAGPSYFYSLPMFEPLLGDAEKLCIQMIISDIQGAPTIKVDTQWSNDRSVWTNKKSNIVTGTSNAAYFGTDTTSGGTFARCAIYFTAGTNAYANVQLIVCGRAEQSWV